MKLRAGLAIVLVLGLAMAGRASGAGAAAERGAQPARNTAATTENGGHNTACQSFAAGYRAYEAHQLPTAITQLRDAVRRCAALGDYALIYLGRSQRESANFPGAAASFEQLTNNYPRSIFAADAMVELAQLEYSMGKFDLAEKLASQVIAGPYDSGAAESARFILAQALTAGGHFDAAYAELQTLRERYPRGPFDARARTAAYALLGLHPELADTLSLQYRRGEAVLLLREEQSRAARDQLKAALLLSSTPRQRAELLWLLARADRIDADRESADLLEYLKVAPNGPSAAAALDRLGHLYWRVDDTANARQMFGRVASEFPH
ncbi:MAG: tetratricopeptide repeat protein, partial [Candidatus Binataceae bacterium]